MPNFTGASSNRTSKVQTTKSGATRSSDVAGRGQSAANRGAGNRQFQNGTSRPAARPNGR